MVPLCKLLYIAFLRLIIASDILIKRGLRMLDFKRWATVLHVGNLSPLGDRGLWLTPPGVRGRRDETRLGQWAGIDSLSDPGWW